MTMRFLRDSSRHEWGTVIRVAFPITLPVLFGYVAIGIPFGLMLVKAGYPWWMAPLMGLFMYAGAGQYLAVGMFAAAVPLPAMAVAMLLVNIRHIVYGLSLIKQFQDVGSWKPYLVFSLTDETYALLTGVKLPDGFAPGSFYGTIALLNQSYWILGGIIGALAGALIPFSFQGIDFALTALFVVLLMDQLARSRDFVPPAIGIACAVAALIVAGPGNMLIVALAGAIVLLALTRGRQPC